MIETPNGENGTTPEPVDPHRFSEITFRFDNKADGYSIEPKGMLKTALAVFALEKFKLELVAKDAMQQQQREQGGIQAANNIAINNLRNRRR